LDETLDSLRESSIARLVRLAKKGERLDGPPVIRGHSSGQMQRVVEFEIARVLPAYRSKFRVPARLEAGYLPGSVRRLSWPDVAVCQVVMTLRAIVIRDVNQGRIATLVLVMTTGAGELLWLLDRVMNWTGMATLAKGIALFRVTGKSLGPPRLAHSDRPGRIVAHLATGFPGGVGPGQRPVRD
jgi:hypothetical protein